MAANNIANYLTDFLQTQRIASCRRILAKVRALQISGDWANNRDIADCWRKGFGKNDRLPESYDITASYLDTGDGSAVGAVLMSHGVPGYGRTQAPMYFRQSNDERAEFLVDCANAVGLKRVDAVVGHSAGCYPLIKLGADERLSAESFCRALVLVNPGGILNPHRAVQPYWVLRLGSKLYYMGFRWLIRWTNYLIWRYVLGFRTISQEVAMEGLHMVANIGLPQLPGFIQRLATDPAAPRVLMIYAEDDHFVEKERCDEVATALGVPLENVITVSSGQDIEIAVEHVRVWWEANEGHRHTAVVFKKGMGGHFLQKHQAAFITSCLETLVGKNR